MNLTNLNNSIQGLENKVSQLQGSVNILEEQYTESTETLLSLKDEQIINIKSIELLNLVQKTTKELIQNLFESVVSKALQFVHQDNNYVFGLEFDRHGHIPKMRFLMKTPKMQESHEILTTRAGGSKDIIALALRLVLLEVSKNNGFLFLDEIFKRLDNDETIKKSIEFIQEIQKNTGRQIILISHKSEIINSVANPIIIK